MTVSTTNSSASYTGNGSTTEFSVTFEFFDAGEVKVYTRTIATGVQTLKAIETDYTLSGGAGSTGTVTFLVPPPSTDEVHVFRDTTRTQPNDFTPSQRFPSASVERALDRGAMRDQDDELQVGKALRAPLTDDSALSMVLPNSVTRASKVLGFDSSGAPVATTQADQSATTVIATNSTTARSHAERWGEVYNVKDYGALGNGSANDATAINAAIAQANTDGGGVVHFPRGTYLVSASVTMKSNVWLQGAGIGATTIKRANSAADLHLLNAATASNDYISVSDMEIDGNRANNTSTGHGIRLDDGATEVRIWNVFIHDTYSYGIGLQATSTGYQQIFIDSVHIKDVGSDGIDIKDPASTNENIFLSNILVDNWGLGFLINDPDDASEPWVTTQSGLDLRGIVSVANVQCINNNLANRTISGVSKLPANAGIRFRVGEAGTTAGKAARRSSLTNFYTDGTSQTARGLVLGGVDCVASNGVIHLTGADVRCVAFDATAVNENSFNNTVSNVEILDSGDTAIKFETDTRDNIVDGCKIVNAATRGVVLDGEDNIVQGCDFFSCNSHALTVAGNRNVVKDNTFRETVGDAIQILTDTTKTVVKGNSYYASTGDNLDNASAATPDPDLNVSGDIEYGVALPLAVASGSALTIPYPAEYVSVTGTSTITSIHASTSFKGRIVTLHFASTADINHAGNIKLAGAANFTSIAAHTTLTLACDGTNWVEVSRSVNS